MILADIFGPTWPSIEVSDLCEHTAEITAGCAFFAVATDAEQARKHGLLALESGAAIVVSPHAPASSQNESNWFVYPSLANERDELAAKFYGYPARHLDCVAVTGTNGKTSVAFYVASMSNLLGEPCGYVGTLGWGLLEDLRDPNMTTPNPTALQRNLAALVIFGCKRVAVEVSSHALAQRRAHNIPFRIGVFTNLTRDHLDYHGSLEAYAEAKLRLFTEFPLQLAILGRDDAFSSAIAQKTRAQVQFYGKAPADDAGMQGELEASWNWRRLSGGQTVSWQFGTEEITASIAAVAEFTVENISAAVAVMHGLGHSATAISKVIGHIAAVPGRMQIVASETAHGTVVVDYAHTPDALRKALLALRSGCQGQLICVVGCGGDRDRGKRPQMAAAATECADITWLTSDNPRSESPADIVEDMRPGVVDTQQVRVELDRKEAIRRALLGANTRDVVLIAGKGHEDYQEIGVQRLPFDDAAVARSLLGEL